MDMRLRQAVSFGPGLVAESVDQTRIFKAFRTFCLLEKGGESYQVTYLLFYSTYQSGERGN